MIPKVVADKDRTRMGFLVDSATMIKVRVEPKQNQNYGRRESGIERCCQYRDGATRLWSENLEVGECGGCLFSQSRLRFPST